MPPPAGTSLQSRLLVATPALGDPNFEETVVLVLEHSPEDGAVGVILNRPTATAMEGLLAGWHRLAATPPVLFLGGPVAPNAAICLARPWPGEGRVNGFEPLLGFEQLFGSSGPIGTLDLDLDPDLCASSVQDLRVFVGYAGWAGGQVETELESGSWFVVDASPDDAFSGDPGALWRTVLGRQEGRLAVFANYPPDPRVN